MKKNDSIYNRRPIRIIKGIPVFSQENDYIRNYQQIAKDQLREIKKTGENPWIKEELWQQLENSTKDLILKYSQGGKILDVGVGLGRLFSMLFSSYEKYGIDISFDLLKIAHTKGINVCFSSIEGMPYKKEFFDVVVCTDVLEHVLDLNEVVKKILSVLKKDGTLIVRVPYKEDLSRYLAPNYPYQYVHLRNFDEKTLTLLFEKIFHCQVLEIKKAGTYTVEGSFDFYFPNKIRQILLKISLLTNRLHPKLYTRSLALANKLKPTVVKNAEINIVVKK